jgi:mannose-6-phosphate isomerase-like protein (cupin superfamily)
LTSPNLRGHERFTTEPKKVDKPWGYELIFAVTERYAGKLLHVKAGESLSLQFHNVKDESWYVLEGRALLEIGRAGHSILDQVTIAPGEAYHFPPGTVHRVTGIEDTRILEVSTAHLDDVVRLDDSYGREGTSEP